MQEQELTYNQLQEIYHSELYPEKLQMIGVIEKDSYPEYRAFGLLGDMTIQDGKKLGVKLITLKGCLNNDDRFTSSKQFRISSHKIVKIESYQQGLEFLEDGGR